MRYPQEAEEDTSDLATLDVLCRLDWGEASVGEDQGLFDERSVCSNDIVDSPPFLPWTERQYNDQVDKQRETRRRILG